MTNILKKGRTQLMTGLKIALTLSVSSSLKSASNSESQVSCISLLAALDMYNCQK